MVKKKKLCIISPVHWSASIGGSEYQIKCLIERLAPLNEFEIYYLTKVYDHSFQSRKYTIIRVKNSWPKLQDFFFLDTFKIMNSLCHIRPDVILQRVGCAYTGIAAYYAKKNKCNMVFHVSSDNDILLETHAKEILGYVHERMEYRFIRYALKYCPHIITQTQQQAEYLKVHYNRKPIAIIPNFHPLPEGKIEKKDPIKVVWVANFKPLKQPEYFVRLAKELIRFDRNVKFIMIGAPYPVSELQQSMEREIGQVQNLAYLGALPIEQVNATLDGAHIFINTSKYEGFPNTFIQSWVRKVPVVSLNSDPDDVIEKQQIGFLTGTFEKMIERVLYLIDNPLVREEMGERARKYAIGKHSEVAIDAYAKILHGIQPLQ